jgi:ankyrin repeat protein
MNKFIKLLCVSILATASVHAMRLAPNLGEQLIAATREGNERGVQLLLSIADNTVVNDNKNNSGSTALMFAAHDGHANIVRMLIDADANVNHINNTGTTALMLAAHAGHANIVRMLIEAKANVNRTNNSGSTALLAATYGNQLECARELIAGKANINYADDNEYTALYTAINKGNDTYAQELINAHADVNQINSQEGDTPLIHAMIMGKQNIVQMLIDGGADVNLYHASLNKRLIEQQCRPPLVLAARQNNLKYVQALIAAKAQLNLASAKGVTALMEAERATNQPICELLVEKMLQPTEEQKAQMRIFLGCLKKTKGLGETYRNRKNHFKAHFLACAYEQNKEKFIKKDPASMACQEVAKLPEGPIKQALLDKYNSDPHANSADESSKKVKL